MPPIDWKNPDYTPIFEERAMRLRWIRRDPDVRVPQLIRFYSDLKNVGRFIDDWGMTYDPRNAERGLPTRLPFILFPKQHEWIAWMLERWQAREPGLTEKSRDAGVSWLALSVACTVCNFQPGVSVGFGSRKEEYVDKLGHPKSLFWKARMFMEMLPVEFRRGWTRDDAPHMRISFPATGSVITGEAGDNIGRGDRSSWYVVDESAHLERPQLVEASLSATTNCRIDISSANGMANPFATKIHAGKIKKFTFHWRDDPRKDDEWYAHQLETLDAVTVAQEIDINYSASTTGILIPSEWINSAIDADKKLGFVCTGKKSGALDVADEGVDKNGFSARTGIRLDFIDDWSGKGSDTFATCQHAFHLCDELGLNGFRYDGDGLGAGIRGDARVINDARALEKRPKKEVWEFRGSGKVVAPDMPVPTAFTKHERVDSPVRLNGDYFANAKAQSFWNLRVRFQRTHRAVKAGTLDGYGPDDLIVLAGDMANLVRLVQELSQPTYGTTLAGKILVNKKPDGSKSPNLADSVMINYALDGRTGYSLEDLRAALAS